MAGMELPTMDANGWRHRAYAEAQAIVQELPQRTMAFDDVLGLLAVAWLQGFNLGAHETLGEAEKAFQRLQEDLTA